MKVKTSVTLSPEVLARVDRYLEGENKRSAFIEAALDAYLQLLERGRRDQSDRQVMDRISQRLNREARDVLRYQADLPE